MMKFVAALGAVLSFAIVYGQRDVSVPVAASYALNM